MSFVLNRNVKEAKVIKYSGGEYTVSVENNNKLKFINLKPISKSNLIEKNNLKKVYLINIGQQNNNGQKIFLVGTTKQFKETAVMNVVGKEEEEGKKENQNMSNIYSKSNNNTRINYGYNPMMIPGNYKEESKLSPNQKSRLEKLYGQESPNPLMRERRITPKIVSEEEEENQTMSNIYGKPNNNKMTYTNNPLYKKKLVPKSMNVIVEKKPINILEKGTRVIYKKNSKEEKHGKISYVNTKPSGRILYNFINNKGKGKLGVSRNYLEIE